MKKLIHKYTMARFTSNKRHSNSSKLKPFLCNNIQLLTNEALDMM